MKLNKLHISYYILAITMLIVYSIPSISNSFKNGFFLVGIVVAIIYQGLFKNEKKK